jgi:ABC-type uncharacterized transport system ATPase subunit
MVEQNAMEALRMSDRAYVLSMGTVALTGAANSLMSDPQVRELYLRPRRLIRRCDRGPSGGRGHYLFDG